MTGKVLEIQNLIARNSVAASIADKYQSQYAQMSSWIAEKKELRNYIFATDTTKTSNSTLPWKNKTTLPKLCQIRDNLHANYMSAWFSTDDWLRWEGYTEKDETLKKRKAIEAYMKNKVRESGFRTTIMQLAYDWIDYGNCFAEVVFVNESKEDPETGESIPGYVGPKLIRKSPFDQIFNLSANSYEESYKITRYLKTLGELKAELVERPDLQYNKDIINYLENVRRSLGGYNSSDIDKAEGYAIDGFGSLSEYYQQEYVEILEFEGNIHDENGILKKNRIITVVDRSQIIRDVANPSWMVQGNKLHVGWRFRPDNLMAMGPLDNLVGMQYRIDHLENMKADAGDLSIHPPLVIKGNVEAFEWGPGAEIYVGDDGEVTELGKNLQALFAAESEIAVLEQRMEEMAGAPKQAMGFRTPGEKTAFEVSSLDNASSRIFQDKTTHFELNFIEKALNMMLEIARRTFQGDDIVRVLDEDFGAAEFLKITKEDITATGKLRPTGARHFAKQNQLVQNLMTIYNSPLGEAISPHVSTKKLAKVVEELLGLEKFDLVRDNIGLIEQAESQQILNQAQQTIEEEDATPIEEESDAI